MTDQTAPTSDFIFYASGDGQTPVECRFNEAKLTIRKFRIVQIGGELMEDSVVRNFRITESGKLHCVDCFCFDDIISAVCRVKPATKYLVEAA